VFGGILERMILRELVKVSALVLPGLTGILLLVGMLHEALERGLNLPQVVSLIPLLIPPTLPITLPASVLFAACQVYGRLARDNELQAITGSGVHPLRLLLPGVYFGLAMGAATMALYYRIIPASQDQIDAWILRDVEDLMYARLRSERQVSFPWLQYEIFARDVRDQLLITPIFKRRAAVGAFDVVVWAERGELRVDSANHRMLIRLCCGEVSGEDGTVGCFEDRVWELPVPPFFRADRERSARVMDWPELVRARREAAATAAAPTGGAEESGPAAGASQRRHQARGRLAYLETELHTRPAMALGCLLFVLVGCPMGARFNQRDFLSAFVVCFLPIIVLYYPLLVGGNMLARRGRLPAGPAVWSADAVLLVLAVLLCRRSVR